jgi:hypothetical protein
VSGACYKWLSSSWRRSHGPESFFFLPSLGSPSLIIGFDIITTILPTAARSSRTRLWTDPPLLTSSWPHPQAQTAHRVVSSVLHFSSSPLLENSTGIYRSYISIQRESLNSHANKVLHLSLDLKSLRSIHAERLVLDRSVLRLETRELIFLTCNSDPRSPLWSLDDLDQPSHLEHSSVYGSTRILTNLNRDISAKAHCLA